MGIAVPVLLTIIIQSKPVKQEQFVSEDFLQGEEPVPGRKYLTDLLTGLSPEYVIFVPTAIFALYEGAA